MDILDPFAELPCDEQTRLAERELASFIAAVTALYGSEQAELSAEDWLEESDSVANPPFSTERDWREVSIAASTRLTGRLAVSWNEPRPASS